MTHTLLLDPQSGSTQEAFHASLAPDLADKLDQVMQRDRSFFLQRSKTAFNTIKNPAPKQKASAQNSRGDRSETYPFGLISILIFIVFLL